ncbi:hypothetical protein D9M68_885570 [compost metagenome]
MCFKSTNGVFIKSRGEDNRGRLLDQLQHFKAIDLGHLYIQEYQIGMKLLNSFYSLKSIAAFCDQLQLRMLLQIFLYNTAGQWFIVYDNYFAHIGSNAGMPALLNLFIGCDCRLRHFHPGDKGMIHCFCMQQVGPCKKQVESSLY